MEQNEKIKKPDWVVRVESLPEIVRQQVGATCAGCISTLVQLGLIDFQLYSLVVLEADNILDSSVSMDSEDLGSHANV